MRAIIAAAIGILLLAGSPAQAEKETALSPELRERIGRLAIQHNGRVKPFDSFAREMIRQLTGKPAWKRQHPVETILGIISTPEKWQAEPVLSVPFLPLREPLGLSPQTKFVSYDGLIETRRLMRRLPPIVQKQQADEQLSMLENETMDLYGRFVAFNSLIENKLVIAVPPEGETYTWRPVLEPEGYGPQEAQALRTAWSDFLNGLRAGNPTGIQITLAQLEQQVKRVQPAAYPADWRLDWEIAYNKIQPFSLARTLYLAAFVLFLAGFVRKLPLFGSGGAAVLWAALAVHIAGIISRVVLGGRPPVSNFFETMLWLPLVAVIVGLVLDKVYKTRILSLSAAFLSGITLALAEHVPLDPSITPVVAVLRSNMWLTIHVLTIVASYGALALATVIAHLYGAIFFLKGPRHHRLEELDLFVYRSIQIGVVLLASGIMLGGVWANASWGRYWGWDPKETWALITLLWFLAILHGRFAGWFNPLRTAVATIAGFFLLLMTYYGVSFYLVGLHSYAGGTAKPLPALLVWYAVAEVLFISVVGFKGLVNRRPA